ARDGRSGCGRPTLLRTLCSQWRTVSSRKFRRRRRAVPAAYVDEEGRSPMMLQIVAGGSLGRLCRLVSRGLATRLRRLGRPATSAAALATATSQAPVAPACRGERAGRLAAATTAAGRGAATPLHGGRVGT